MRMLRKESKEDGCLGQGLLIILGISVNVVVTVHGWGYEKPVTSGLCHKHKLAIIYPPLLIAYRN